MDAKYQDWIDSYLEEQNGLIRAMCGHATEQMVRQFPELKRTPGWIYYNGGCDEHYWCVAPDGSIVDPTISQFEGTLRYQELQPGDSIRVGRCMNCGMGIYAVMESIEDLKDKKHARCVCSEECESELTRSM